MDNVTSLATLALKPRNEDLICAATSNALLGKVGWESYERIKRHRSYKIDNLLSVQGLSQVSRVVAHLEAEGTEALLVMSVPHHHPGNYSEGEQRIRHPQTTDPMPKGQKPFASRYPEVVQKSSTSSLLERVGRIGPVQ